MAGKDLHAQQQRTHSHPQTRHVQGVRLPLLLRADQLDAGENERQPGGRRDDHAEVDADDEEAGERVGDRRHDAGRARKAQQPGKDVEARGGDPQLQGGEEAVRKPQGQYVEENAGRVECGMLPGREERHPREEPRVPQAAPPPSAGLQQCSSSRGDFPARGRRSAHFEGRRRRRQPDPRPRVRRNTGSPREAASCPRPSVGRTTAAAAREARG